MDRNYLIDLALSIAQDAADEWHDKEAVSGLETKLKNISDDCQELIANTKAELEIAKKDYEDGAILRRAKTDALAELVPHYDYHKRCTLKHRGAAFVQMSEAYLANPTDKFYDLLVRSEERYWKAFADFAGIDAIENCGRCLSDELNKISRTTTDDILIPYKEKE